MEAKDAGYGEAPERISRRVLLTAALGWLLLSLFSTSGTWWTFRGRGEMVPWADVFAVSAVGTLPWLAATPLVLWLGGRFPVHDSRWPRSLGVHLPASLAVLAATSVLAEAASAPLLGLPVEGAGARALSPARGWLWIDWLLYWVVLGVGAFWRLARRARWREARAAELAVSNARLRAELTEAHLANLRARLEPHFLFNALNSLQSLVRTGDTRRAGEMIGRLGALLRSALTSDRRLWIPLAEEAEHARAYLEIERLRFGERMRATVSVAPELSELPVPPLLLQPLLENAVRHGLAEIVGPGRVEVVAAGEGDSTVIRVENDGPPVAAPPGEGDEGGYGLDITRERLERAYGGRAWVRFEARPGGGLRTEIVIPGRPGEAEPRPDPGFPVRREGVVGA